MSEEEIRYRLRLQEYARRLIDAESDRLKPLIGDEGAIEWIIALREALASLSWMPGRCPLAPEANRFTGVWRGARHKRFQRTPDGAAWRILFVIEESDLEAPTVRVLAMLHANAGPMTRAQARQALEEL